MNKGSKVFVAGHGGLVGSAVLRSLHRAGYAHVLTRTHDELDLADQSAVRRFFVAERPDLVILAAAKVGGIMANSTYKADFIYENLAIGTNVVHAAHKAGVAKLVNLGSSCIYPKHAKQPMREEDLLTGPLEPTNEPYAIAKIAVLKLCRYYHEQYGCNFVSAMPTNLYGPRDNFDPYNSHVLAALIRKIDDAKGKGGPVELWGDGSPLREFLHVDDLAKAVLFIVENVDARSLCSQVPDLFLNVGSEKEVSIRDLAGTVAEVVGYDGEFSWDRSKPNGTPRKLMDSSRIGALGWKASVPLAVGLQSTYDWYKTNAK